MQGMQNVSSGYVKKISAVSGYILIAAVGVVIAVAVHTKSNNDFEIALNHYKEQSGQKAEENAKAISSSLKLLYQGIRTISFLPSVREIDRYGKNLDKNARASIEQIYKNMVSNISVSEIYIVPVDLEPEKIDPVTGEMQTPILMYDGSEEADKSDNPEEKKPLITSVKQAENVEEVEIYEYRLLKEHMAYFKENYPDQKHIDKLNLPIVGGHEVLTCDNDEYKNTKIDADRSGIVLSVPFFAPDGKLKGSVSAIIRSNVLRDMLPYSNAALVNTEYSYKRLAKSEGQQQESIDYISRAEPDSSLLFSTVLPIEMADPRSKWELWIGYPDSLFLESADAKSVQDFRYIGYLLTAIFTCVGFAIFALVQRAAKNRRENIASELKRQQEKILETERMQKLQEEQRLQAETEKRAAIQKLADRFESSVKNIVNMVASSAVQLQQTASNLAEFMEKFHETSQVAVSGSVQTNGNVQSVAAAIEKMTASIAEISDKLNSSTDVVQQSAAHAEKVDSQAVALASATVKVKEVINIISEIAEEVNLLALNATIESARAGEAGKGFSVVAGQVKNLADQTGKSVQEIESVIAEMNAASEEIIDSLNGIKDSIENITGASSSIAAAIEEQTSTTSEISRNMQCAAQGAQHISHSLSRNHEYTVQARSSSVEVLDAARALYSLAEKLNKEVDLFLKTIRE